MWARSFIGLTCWTLRGESYSSRKLENDVADVCQLIDEALSLAEEVLWRVDQPGGSAALLLALLWERDQRILYMPGLSVNRASDAYRGESKTDARVIADQARMRADLGELEPGEEELAELRILLGRRRDLVIDQNRPITRLGEALLSLSPALERALDLNRKGHLTLLTHDQRASFGHECLYEQAQQDATHLPTRPGRVT